MEAGRVRKAGSLMECKVQESGRGEKGGTINPFVVESPEKLTPKEIVDLFVENFTRIETVKKRKHTIIWGSRGSGKSMMLRYLEPQCQSILYDRVDNFLNQPESFFAVFFPCKEGQFNKSELDLLKEKASIIITEHMINLSVADRVINSLMNQLPKEAIEKDTLVEFVLGTVRLFDKASIASSLTHADEIVKLQEKPLLWLQALFLSEARKVNTFLRDIVLRDGNVIYDGATSGYHDFLLPFIRLVKGIPALSSCSIYLMIDDADRLSKAQQSILNTWIANRDHNVLCIKISARPENYKTLDTRDGGLIEQPHDYSEIDVDELYTQSKSDYSKKIKLIAEKRLKLAGLQVTDIAEFLPADPHEQQLFEDIKIKTAEEWIEKGKPGRKGDFVNRYASARLFQHLKEKKKRKNYAGFQNMVHLSSGIIRDFLEPCYLMYDECVAKGHDPREIGHILSSIQDDILYRYSEYLLIGRFEDIRKDLPPEYRTHLEKLRRLVESLGRLFYERLHDKEAREARLFSFTVRGQEIPEDIQEVLRLGRMYRFFQIRTYSSKEGGGRENWYILNRRLCPVYKLDPTGFEGRISLTPDFLKLALENPAKFVRLRLKQSKDIEQSSLFSLEEEHHSEGY